MKIRFKNITGDLDFSKVFPIIEKSDYTLLAGRELIIEDSIGSSMTKNGYLSFDDLRISSQLIQIISAEGCSEAQSKVVDKLNESTINQEKLVDIIFKGIELKSNVLLYGRGGHNKSQGTISVLSEMKAIGLIDSDPFVMTFGDGLTEEALFGGLDVKKFSEEGVMEYLVKNSFLEHEIVVIEELFDGPPQVLLALKDVLTSGYLRKGNQKHKSKVKTIIALTNKSKESFSEDDSLEALAQRFAYTLKVEWDSYNKSDFIKLFEKVLGPEEVKLNASKLYVLADIIAQNNAAQDSFVSPRTAISAAKLYIAGGDLNYISDISPKILSKFLKETREIELDVMDELVLSRSKDYLIKNDLASINIDEGVINILNQISKTRGGNQPIIPMDRSNNAKKLEKAKFLLTTFKSHSFSSKNIHKSMHFLAELSETIKSLSI